MKRSVGDNSGDMFGDLELAANALGLHEGTGSRISMTSTAAGFAYTAALDTDHIYHRGTQEYELRGGRGSGTTPV